MGIVSHVSITESVRRLTWVDFSRYIWWVRVTPSTIFIFQVFLFLSNHQTIHGLMIHTTPRFARRQSRRSRVNQSLSKFIWYPLKTFISKIEGYPLKTLTNIFIKNLYTTPYELSSILNKNKFPYRSLHTPANWFFLFLFFLKFTKYTIEYIKLYKLFKKAEKAENPEKRKIID